MHAVVRNYSGAGAKQLIDVLEQHKADVEATLRKVPGLLSYTLLRSGEGGMSVTVCKDKAGAEESLKVAREWIQKNASNIHANPPVVTEGSVIVQIKERATAGLVGGPERVPSGAFHAALDPLRTIGPLGSGHSSVGTAVH